MAKKSKQPEAEAKLEAQLKAIKERAKDREYTDAEEKQIATLKKELGGLRFVRLAIKRVPAAVAKIRNIGGLAGKNYSCTRAQADYVVAALKDAIAQLEKAFAGDVKTASSFQLPQ